MNSRWALAMAVAMVSAAVCGCQDQKKGPVVPADRTKALGGVAGGGCGGAEVGGRPAADHHGRFTD